MRSVGILVAVALIGCGRPEPEPEVAASDPIPETNAPPFQPVETALQRNANGRFPVMLLRVPDGHTNGMPGVVTNVVVDTPVKQRWRKDSIHPGS